MVGVFIPRKLRLLIFIDLYIFLANQFTSTPLPVKIINTHLWRLLKCEAHARPTESEHLRVGTEDLDL